MFVGPTASHAPHHLERVIRRGTAMLILFVVFAHSRRVLNRWPPRQWIVRMTARVLSSTLATMSVMPSSQRQPVDRHAHVDFGSVPRPPDSSAPTSWQMHQELASIAWGCSANWRALRSLTRLQRLAPSFSKAVPQCKGRLSGSRGLRLTALREAGRNGPVSISKARIRSICFRCFLLSALPQTPLPIAPRLRHSSNSSWAIAASTTQAARSSRTEADPTRYHVGSGTFGQLAGCRYRRQLRRFPHHFQSIIP